MAKSEITSLDVPSSFLADIRRLVVDARQSAYSSINAVMLDAYWKIGRRIVEEEQGGKQRAGYGKRLIEALSESLSAEFGKGFSPAYLRNFRQFYLYFPDFPIQQTRLLNLNWSHILRVLRLDDARAREWYLQEAASDNWSVRTLDRNISSQYYHRLLASSRPESVRAEMIGKTTADHPDRLAFIKNPLVAEFLGLAPNTDFTESSLEGAIISHLQRFLMELGKGFAFVARQQHIRTDVGEYFIDLVFYNYILKCFVLIDLKTAQISHQDVGQMDMYVRMYDEVRRGQDDNPTIGIILCSETSRDIARYSVLNDNKRLFASKYLLYLPSEEELKREIDRQKEIFLLQHPEFTVEKDKG